MTLLGVVVLLFVIVMEYGVIPGCVGIGMFLVGFKEGIETALRQPTRETD